MVSRLSASAFAVPSAGGAQKIGGRKSTLCSLSFTMRNHYCSTGASAVTVQRPFAPTVPTTQAKESLAAIGRIHRYAAEQLAATLSTAQRFEHTRAGARRLTPAQTL